MPVTTKRSRKVVPIKGRGGMTGRDGAIDTGIGQDQFQFDFRQEIDGVFAAAVDFGVALLATEALDFCDSHAFDANFTERILHFLEFEWFYDGFDFLHSFWF